MRWILNFACTFLVTFALSAVAAEEPKEQAAQPEQNEQTEPAQPIVKVTAPAPAPSNLKTIDVGGVKLELVEIPAGKFTMGATEVTPEPRWIGYSILGGGGGLAFLLVAAMLFRAIRERGRPQFSLLWYTVLVLALGTTMLGVQRMLS